MIQANTAGIRRYNHVNRVLVDQTDLNAAILDFMVQLTENRHAL